MRATAWAPVAVSYTLDPETLAALDPHGFAAESEISYFGASTGYPAGGQANQKALVDSGHSQDANYYPGLEDTWSPGFTVPAARTIDILTHDSWGRAGRVGRDSADFHRYNAPWDHRVMRYTGDYTIWGLRMPRLNDLAAVATTALGATEPPGDGDEQYSFLETQYALPDALTITYTGIADTNRLTGSMKVYAMVNPNALVSNAPPTFAWGSDPVSAGWTLVATATTGSAGVNGGTTLVLDLSAVPVPTLVATQYPELWLVFVGQDAFVDPTIATAELAADDLHHFALSWTDVAFSAAWTSLDTRWVGGEFSADGPGRDLGAYLMAWNQDSAHYLSTFRASAPAVELQRVEWPFGDATAGVADSTAILGVSRPDGRQGQLVYLLMSGLDDPSEPVYNAPVADGNPAPTVTDPAPIGTSDLDVSTPVTVTTTPTVQDLSYVVSAS